MASNQIIGYILAGLGLVIIAFSNKIAALPFLGSKGLAYTIVAGVACIAAAIALLMGGSSKSKPLQAAEEVPIYEGTGKKRKIVGYQKAG